MNIATYCNSVVLVSPFFSHNSLSWALKCICQFGSSFIIWNVPQCLFKNSYSLIVPSLGNGKSEKNYLCCMQQYLTYLILDSGIYCRPGNLYLPQPPRKGNGRFWHIVKHSWPKNQWKEIMECFCKDSMGPSTFILKPKMPILDLKCCFKYTRVKAVIKGKCSTNNSTLLKVSNPQLSVL